MRKDFALSETQRADAREAIKLLTNSGISLTDAAKFFLGLGGKPKDANAGKDINGAIFEFLGACRTKKLRDATIKFYREFLSRLADKFGEMKMDALTREKLMPWLKPIPFSSANAIRRSGTVLYNFGKDQIPAWCEKNPFEKLPLIQPKKETSIGFLSVKQCRQLMASATPATKHALALMLFAGIRPEEIRGQGKPPLEWQHIDRREKTIYIPASISKVSGRPRLLQHKVPANLWKWLADGKDDGAISDIARKTLQQRAKAAACPAGEPWPHDAMRHTFATYHVAAFGDIAATAELLGHGTSLVMLKRHYQGAARKAEGELFFALVP